MFVQAIRSTTSIGSNVGKTMKFSVYNVFFLIGLLVAAGLTLVALVTPAWRQLKNARLNNTSEQSTSDWFTDGVAISYGVITGSCTGSGGFDACKNYFENAPDWKKASLACLISSLAFCALAFVWSCIACCMCCCKACLAPPLPIFAGLACILDVAGVTLYGVKSGQSLGGIPTSWQELESKGDFGYSMWIGIGAILVLFVVTLVGIGLVKVSKVSPI